VLEAAQAAGIDIPLQLPGRHLPHLRGEGSGDMVTEEMLALTPQELAAGWRLTCVATPNGRLHI